MNEDVIDALESSAPLPRNQELIGTMRTASRRDILAWRGRLMQFLDDLDGDLSVSEVRLALEEYE